MEVVYSWGGSVVVVVVVVCSHHHHWAGVVGAVVVCCCCHHHHGEGVVVCWCCHHHAGVVGATVVDCLLLPPPPPWRRSSLLPPWYSCGTLVIPWVRCHANWPMVSSTAQSASVRTGAISIGQSGVFPWEVLHNQLKSVDACCGGIAVVQCAGTLMKNWDVQISGCSFRFISKPFWKLLLGSQ